MEKTTKPTHLVLKLDDWTEEQKNILEKALLEMATRSFSFPYNILKTAEIERSREIILLDDYEEAAQTCLMLLVNATGAEFEDEDLAVGIIKETLLNFKPKENAD